MYFFTREKKGRQEFSRNLNILKRIFLSYEIDIKNIAETPVITQPGRNRSTASRSSTY